MKIIKLSRIATALGLALSFNSAQAVTLDMDDTPALTAPALNNIFKATGVWLELEAQGKLTDYDGVRYIHVNNADRFYINVPDVDSSELERFQALKNFYVEGDDANTDTFLLSAFAESQDPSNPNPTKDRYEYIFDTLNLDNIHLQVKDQNSSSEFFGQPDLIIYDAINLNSSRLTFGSERQLFWRDDHAINVTGTGNVINIGSGVWDSPQTFSTSLNIADNSDLRLEDNSVIYNEFNGNLTMGPGSTLDIDRSQIVLVSATSNPKFIASTINNATINLSGPFTGSRGSSLYLTDPTITDSTITLANNTVFRSYRRDTVTGTKDPGIVTFEGNTTLNLGDRALFTGQADGAAPTDSFGTFHFNNGTTTVNGNENSEFKASDWVIDNATVLLTNTEAESSVSGLTIKDSTYTGRGIPFDKLRSLSLTNSTVSGPVNFGNTTSSIWVGNNFKLDPGLRKQLNGSAYYADGMAFDFPIAAWSGNNTFVSNIDPKGTEIDVGSGIKSYSNKLYIRRANVTGFDTLNIELKSVDYTLLASDYATGGAGGDGIYDLVFLDDGATTDADPNISLDGNFPALLTAAQVNRSSNNSPVRVQLSELPAQALALHPSVTPTHQATTITQTIVQPSTGNTVQTQVTVTPDNNGGATQTVTTTTTTPSGESSNTTSTSTLQPATGSNNLQNTANLLDSSHNNGNTDIINSLGNITNSQLASHFNSIHAEPYSSNMTVALEHTDAVMNSVFSQVRKKVLSPNRNGSIEDATPTTRQGMWLDAGYIKGDVEGEDDLGNFEYSLSHLTLGIDVAKFDKATLGLYFSAGSYDMDEHDRAVEEFSNDAYHLGVYFNQPVVGQWKLRSLLGYAYGDHSSSRLVQLSNTSSNATADFNSHSIYAGVIATTNWYSNKWVSLSPDLAFNYVYFEQQGFSEQGDPSLSLQLDDGDAQSIITSFGLSATFSSLFQNYAVYPEAYIRYEHDWYARKNNEHKVSAGLVSNPNYKQDFEGQSRGENSIIVGLGLTSDVTSVFQINGSLNITESTHGTESGGSISAVYLW